MTRSSWILFLALSLPSCTDSDPQQVYWQEAGTDLAPDISTEDLPPADTRPVKCGDNLAEGTENCDGKDHRGKTCQSLGYLKGTLACSNKCAWVLSGCDNCGDGKIDKSEQCEGKMLDGQTCKKLGFFKGALACKKCKFDLAGCTNCGNGKVDKGWEECDGASLNGMTCKKLGYKGGTLKCLVICLYNKSGCTS